MYQKPLKTLARLLSHDDLMKSRLVSSVEVIFDKLITFEQFRDNHRPEIVTAKERISRRCPDFHDIIIFMQQRNVERATAKIKNKKCPFILMFETVGKGRSRRLVDQALDVKSCQSGRVERGFALDVIEIGGTEMTASVIGSPSASSAS